MWRRAVTGWVRRSMAITTNLPPAPGFVSGRASPDPQNVKLQPRCDPHAVRLARHRPGSRDQPGARGARPKHVIQKAEIPILLDGDAAGQLLDSMPARAS